MFIYQLIQRINMGISFSFSILLSIMFRTIQSSVDILIYPVSGNFVITILMSIIPLFSFIYLILINLFNSNQKFNHDENQFIKITNSYFPSNSERIRNQNYNYPKRGIISTIYGFFASIFLPIGIISIINFMNHYFVSPSSLSRWTDTESYFWILSIITFEYFLFSIISLFKVPFGLFSSLRFFLLIFLNFLLLIFMILASFQSQIFSFVSIIIRNILIIFVCLLSFIFIFNFQMIWYEIVKNKSHISLISFGFFIGIILYILMNVLIASSFIYNHTTGYFRDFYWVGVFMNILFVVLPILFVKYKSYSFKDSVKIKKENNCPFLNRLIFYTIFMVICISFVLTMTSYLINSRTGGYITPPTNPQNLKLMTFNIQNGFDNSANRRYEDLLNLIIEVDPDIIGLQESETNRISNGHEDLLRYLTDSLEVFSYYGPGSSKYTSSNFKQKDLKGFHYFQNIQF